ncbi:MAG TPA: hypothetical protein VHD32_09325 [Candidatus Didemnitutus sp.]|nr:hypothetical protein [Candidatus Didemnitutus sp.]
MKAKTPKTDSQAISPSAKDAAARLATARRKAEDAKKAARAAKDQLKAAKKIHKRARKLAKAARKEFKELKKALVTAARRRKTRLHRPARVRHEKPATVLPTRADIPTAAPAVGEPVEVPASPESAPTPPADNQN